MYLARKAIGGHTYFFIRESVFKDGVWQSRDLFALGEDPTRYIIYSGGNSFYIDEYVLRAIEEKGVKTDQWELEKIFWPFVKPEIRHTIDNFSAHYQLKRRPRLPTREQMKLQKRFHLFDQRRLTFLKFGGVNIDPLLERPLPFLNVLKDKSRDEIEQLIMEKEMRLKPRETLAYIYASFGLARHFIHRLTKFIPEAQLLKEIDFFFLEELCKIAADESYRMGLSEETVLQDYLSRYVIMHFDRLEKDRAYFERQKARLRRQRQAAARKVLSRAAEVFGVSEEELWRMGKEDILRLFRRQAQKLHPDRGGDHEAFIELRKLFEDLMTARGWQRRF